MDKFDRVFQLHTVLSTHRTAVSMQMLIERLECNKSTVHRIIAMMRDRLGAPIEFDKENGGYRYGNSAAGGAFQLPGLWFNAEELQALRVLQNLLSSLGPGLLEQHLAPLQKRLDELTRHQRLNLAQAAQRIRTPGIAARPAGQAFQSVAAATLQRHELVFHYHSRGKDQRTERRVAPQRIVHYREGWYLDAWDEDAQALRSFAIDRISNPITQSVICRDIAEADLDSHYATGYGIFGGKPDKQAVLRFTAERARWVADEQWHPQQQGLFLPDGRYELKIPYGDPRELAMDILRHGSHVEVKAPDTLRTEIASALEQTLRQYADR